VDLKNFVILERCCVQTVIDFYVFHLQPGKEDWVRHPDWIAALVEHVRNMWIEEYGGIATDWPWNSQSVQGAFIWARKMGREKCEAWMATQKQLFPVPSTGFIYFMRNSRGQIKIGWTSKDPTERRRSLQTGEADEIILVGWMKGSKRQEGVLHVRFAPWRVRSNSEWFHSSPELEKFIRTFSE